MDLQSEEQEIIRQYAEARLLKEKAERLEKAARARALKLYHSEGIAELCADAGTVTITTVNGPSTFDKERARHFMTPEQWQSCVKPGGTQERVTFKPNARAA
jgi:hypothetical protein